jgi:hypothetical protein
MVFIPHSVKSQNISLPVAENSILLNTGSFLMAPAGPSLFFQLLVNELHQHAQFAVPIGKQKTKDKSFFFRNFRLLYFVAHWPIGAATKTEVAQFLTSVNFSLSPSNWGTRTNYKTSTIITIEVSFKFQTQ